ncbi:helix-turn-helix domain-containing protein [Methylocella tundrae]|uniref:helix-turn-helix domain-containing protein n=1 Tax=Methylocella tundrae TaxID=227605 RepID=UPI00106A337E
MLNKCIRAEVSSDRRQNNFANPQLRTLLKASASSISEPVIPPIKLLYSVVEVLKLLSIGRNTFYALIKNNELKATKIRGRTLVHIDEIHRFLRSLPTI